MAIVFVFELFSTCIFGDYDTRLRKSDPNNYDFYSSILKYEVNK